MLQTHIRAPSTVAYTGNQIPRWLWSPPPLPTHTYTHTSTHLHVTRNPGWGDRAVCMGVAFHLPLTGWMCVLRAGLFWLVQSDWSSITCHRLHLRKPFFCGPLTYRMLVSEDREGGYACACVCMCVSICAHVEMFHWIVGLWFWQT